LVDFGKDPSIRGMDNWKLHIVIATALDREGTATLGCYEKTDEEKRKVEAHA